MTDVHDIEPGLFASPQRFAGREQAGTPWIVVTGLDGAGKSTLVKRLGRALDARTFRLPFNEFVRPCLALSGEGTPFGDIHTDRLLFSLDARLANYRIRQWRREEAPLVSQRGWMDNFIFGAVQGHPYAYTEELLQTRSLERASAHIFLVSDPSVAFERIRQDPNKDKYEEPDFMVAQYAQTLRFFAESSSGNAALANFCKIPATLIDTSEMTVDQVYDRAWTFIARCEIDRLCMPRLS